jgi:NAD(P)-dependent dehydrogenase (short-subunit alcohol dehydrogenase family)
VTGGARRLGRAIALALSDAGYAVAVHHHASPRDAASLVAPLLRQRREAVALEADLADPEAVASLLPTATKLLGRPPSLLVNNAAAYPEGSAAELGPSRLAQLHQVNVSAPVALSQAFARRAPAGASVVQVLDARMGDDDPRHAAYLETKRQLAAATRRLAVELAPGVRVNAVAPGAVLPRDGKPWSRAVVEATILKRTPTPDDVAQAVLYLAGAASVTGQTLWVDGGRSVARASRQA